MTQYAYNNVVKYKHFRNKDYLTDRFTNMGGITMAYYQESSDNYVISFSICSINDNFEKKIGRSIAFERVLKDSTSVEITEKTLKEFLSCNTLHELLYEEMSEDMGEAMAYFHNKLFDRKVEVSN